VIGPVRTGTGPAHRHPRIAAARLDEPRSPLAFLDEATAAPVLVDASAGRVWTQDELANAVHRAAERLATDRQALVFCLCGTNAASIIGYLAALKAGHAVALFDAGAPAELLEALIGRYQPAFVVRPEPGDRPEVHCETRSAGPRIAGELAVLLSTSGTTGSPKLVRLSHRNIAANAGSIAQYLQIDGHARAILSLPIHYSYGLSVLHSHLVAGASVILTDHSIMRPEFWTDAARWGATSFAGVPYSYSILKRTGLLRTSMPDTMRTLTQAGGRLAPETVVELHELMRERDGRMWVMYGQTEATARISYVPPEALPDKAHTIGIPIPGGCLSVQSGGGEPVDEPDVEGELIYRGPNVMLGYATGPDELASGDMQDGTLRTGDLGCIDSDGFYRITGRIKRIAKVFGGRQNLDEIEAAASTYGPVAAADGGDQIVLWREAGAGTGIEPDELQRAVARQFGLNPRAFEVREIEALPRTASGKIDYERLGEASAG
jgi:acyl-CoA synthetase (AMP-forming)/AMP-acid ligase II